jgi:hypothetical protein
MDESTLHAHRRLYGGEELDRRYVGDPQRSTQAERELFERLRDNRDDERLQLAQERIAYQMVGRFDSCRMKGACGPAPGLL